jgi:DNA-directed RNA polymerase specialized sigma24 family protein
MSTAVVPPHLLHRRAVELSRRIYASLPWGYRFAQLLSVLAADSLDVFGRVVYAEMVKSVVRGMPDTALGKPAFDLIQDVARKGADAMPPGYGRPFASKVYKILLSKFSDPEIAKEAMSQVLLQVARGKVHIHGGADLADAEALIITIATNAARDLLRARSRRREDSLVRERDDEEKAVDPEDPEAFRRLDHLIPASELKHVLRELRQVHPRAPDWLEAKLQGDSGNEIAAEWGVTPSYVSKWQRLHLPAIQRLVGYHLRQARQSYDYERTLSRAI